MITFEGYSSLYRFHLDAEFAIRKRLILNENGKGELSWADRRESINIAARYLVRDIFRMGLEKDKKFPSILTKGGQLYEASPLLLSFPESPNIPHGLFNKARSAAIEKGANLSHERVFGLSSLALDYWHSAFQNERVFNTGPYAVQAAAAAFPRVISLVDWRTGTVSIKALRALNDAINAMRAAKEFLSMCGNFLALEEIDYLITEFDKSDNLPMLEMLANYDGCTVVAPTDWLSLLELSDKESAEASSVSLLYDSSPKDAIIVLLSEDPTLTKPRVKLKLFPEVSDRRFNTFWAQASESKPEIMKPGRRSTKS
ncbi:hypothetical protein OHI65_21360 [Brucella sp. MAB-22]|uniref:hypothetical protein n=1 Tax=Brucella sp. MAB-22 TaxID=2986424 RepID=UPI00222073E9|nr:hypothetical protein [Brucella sp. MAB-22]UYT56501.1 hypothetical protein OHI65_21360 [Brucella sp. MAB-22]